MIFEWSFSLRLFGVMRNEVIKYFPYSDHNEHPHLIFAFFSSIAPSIVTKESFPKFFMKFSLSNYHSFTVPSNDPDARL